MKQETIKRALKVINRNIKFYQKKLTYQLELRTEAKFNNENLKVESFGDYESNIEKYEIILADLATIKRAIKNNKTSVRVYGTAHLRGYMYLETAEVLERAGFEIDGFGTTVKLVPIEKWVEGTPESWSIYDEEKHTSMCEITS